jgi:molybdenum cofactor guanylyltransferase
MVTSGSEKQPSDVPPSSREGLTLDRLLSCRTKSGKAVQLSYSQGFKAKRTNPRGGIAPAALEVLVRGTNNRPMYHRPMAGIASEVSAFILAGGKSTRMGSDKAFVQLDGRTLLARALDLARSITSNARIVGAAAKFSAFAPVVEDRFLDCGPLGGIHAALRSSITDLNIVLAVDVPFVSKELLEYLIDSASRTSAVVTVPRAGERCQPLCAVYRREFAGVAEEALRKGQYKIDALFDRVMVHVIEEDELAASGFTTSMFRNLNTKEEVDQASAKVRSS